ncbi:acyltransferase family protein [Formosa sp. S-31]|uniref:acyltransferase family protein n=1 Tax=Formosa sp. S-31 TaxID=2790949 RepID=UPI003EC11079
MKLKYYNNLDGIRAIAALMVMFFHFFIRIESTDGFLRFLTKISVFGQTGVTLFFVLSGFLITRILIATKNTEGFFKNFYLRRTLRIFPLYYLFLFLSYYIIPILFGTKIPELNQQLYYYTYLQNFASTFNWDAIGPSHFWSLAVEEHFYLFWPFIVYLFSNKNLIKIILIIIIGALALRWLMLSEGYQVFYFTFTRFDSLAIGALLAIIEIEGGFKKRTAKKFAVLLMSLIVPTVIMWTVFTGTGDVYIQIFKFLFLSGIYFSLIGMLLCLKEEHFVNKILRTKFFSFTGKISYGLYVYHPIVYKLCEHYFEIENVFLRFIFGISFSFLLSVISFYLFESSFLKLKKYFEYNKKQLVAEPIKAS